jgi:protein TonB
MTYNTRKTVPQRLSGLFVVAFLHVIAIYLVASGLTQSAVEKVFVPIETRVIEDQQKKVDEAPPPPPKIETPPPFVPPPDMVIAPEMTTAPSHAITNVTTKKGPPPPPPRPDVAPRSDPRHPVSQPPYPSASQRLGEEGVVILSLYVLENGRVGEARVEKSSGFERLDDAAVRHAKSRWRLLPGTLNGKPHAAWMQIAVRFQLKK